MTQLKLRTVMESIMMFDAYSGDKKMTPNRRHFNEFVE
ncbi:hypothetical protein JCM19233_6691 [Vibrio astriarenae]|nr:hypothetical protein JCM19233_6691 [Vibrio sp. C7]